MRKSNTHFKTEINPNDEIIADSDVSTDSCVWINQNLEVVVLIRTRIYLNIYIL